MKSLGGMWRGVSIALSLGLAGAPIGAQASIGYGAPPPDISNTVHLLKVEGDIAQGQVQYIGEPRQKVTFSGISTWWRLKSFIDTRTMTVTNRLLLDLWFNGGARGFDQATDDEGDALAVTKVASGRDVDNYSERFWVPISEDFLHRHMLTGFAVTVTTASGYSRTITVTPAQVQSQIITEDSVLRPGLRIKTGAAAAAEGAASPASAGVAK